MILCIGNGVENTNADSLSRNPVSALHSVAATSSQPVTTDIQLAQLKDPVVKQLHSGLSLTSKPVITNETQPLLKRYLQIWQQLSIIDNVVCCTYTPRSLQQPVIVPVPHFHCDSLRSLSHMIFPLQDIKALLRHCNDFKGLPIGWRWPRMLPSIVNSVVYVSKQSCQHLLQLRCLMYQLEGHGKCWQLIFWRSQSHVVMTDTYWWSWITLQNGYRQFPYEIKLLLLYQLLLSNFAVLLAFQIFYTQIRE